MSFAVLGVAAPIAIVALVELLKQLFGFSGKWAILAAVLIGLALSLANHVAGIVPGFGEWYEVVIVGVFGGLAACGIYDAAHAPKTKVEENRSNG